MSTNNTSKHLQQPIGIMVILVVCGIILVPGYAKAADTMSSEAAMAEMKEMFGGVPTELQLYPESARAAGWAMMKSTDLNENTAFHQKSVS